MPATIENPIKAFQSNEAILLLNVLTELVL